MTEFSERVEEYIRQDRQWPRQLRINHAKMQMMKAKDQSDEERFWRAIIARNED
jgi:hypothetical protein